MNTFPVTVENLQLRHIGRMLGFLLGLSIVGGFITMHVILVMNSGLSGYIQQGGFSSLIYTVCLIVFGVLLLVPRQRIRRQKKLSVLYSILGVFFVWRGISAIMIGLNEGLSGSPLIFTILLVVACIVIASWNVVATLKQGEQVVVG